jgi:hypothetical protein
MGATTIMESMTVTNATQSQPPVPAAAPAPRRQVRGTYLIVLVLVVLALLAEHLFTLRDLRQAWAVAKSLTERVEDSPEEPGKGSGDQESAGLKAKVADLAARVEAREKEIEKLRTDLARAELKAIAGASTIPADPGPWAARSAIPVPSRSPADGETRGSPDPSARKGAAPAFPADTDDLFAPRPASARGGSGRLLVRDAVSEFSAIDLGSRDGIRKGMRLPLKAAGQEVGTFLVLEVRPSVSAGRVVLQPNRTLDDGVRVER